MLRSKNVVASKPCAVIEDVNAQVDNLNKIAKMKAFRSNLHHGTLLNEMVYWKENIEQLLKCTEQ